MKPFILLLTVLALIPAPLLGQDPGAKAARVLFETGFEGFEGYNPGADLVDAEGRGQNGWSSVGYGGNGILVDPIPEFTGQYAYIGFLGSTNQAFFNLFRPVQLVPNTNFPPVVFFEVTLSLRDDRPTPGQADDFRWSAYTPDDQRLFTLDFHGVDQSINFALDDNQGFRPTDFGFEYGATYRLEMVMSFGRNRWSATLNGSTVVYEQPITTRNQRLSLGSVDAVWAANASGRWDDNYLLFDDYRISVFPPSDIAPVLEMVGLDSTGRAQLRVWGEPGVSYRVQSSNDLLTWTDRATVIATAPDGLATYLDAQVHSGRSYRAVSIP
jgi:hypothetical protein